MLQRSEIGKKRSKKSQAEAILNRIFLTPKNDEYSLVSFEKIGRTYHYVYEWINCPESIKEITSNRIRSKSPLSIGEVVHWIDQLRFLEV
jgi:hypothetical protein